MSTARVRHRTFWSGVSSWPTALQLGVLFIVTGSLFHFVGLGSYAFSRVPRIAFWVVEGTLAFGVSLTVLLRSRIWSSHTGIFSSNAVMTKDLLTGVASRPEIVRHAHLALRDPTSSPSLILFDIDHLARVNHRFGLEAGDHVLKAVSQIIRECLREGDDIGRWGDDEFLVVARSQSFDTLSALPEKVRRVIAGVQVNGLAAITVSAGLTRLQPGDDFCSLVRRTELCLAQAKRNGRNCVESEASGIEQEIAGSQSVNTADAS